MIKYTAFLLIVLPFVSSATLIIDKPTTNINNVTVNDPTTIATATHTSTPSLVRFWGGTSLATSVVNGANMDLYIPVGSGGGGAIQSINSSTVAHHRVVAGYGMTVSNVVDGTTNSIYVSFGDTTPLVSTNTGWSRYQFNQVAAGVGGATSETFTVTNQYGADIVYKSWAGGGGATVNSGGASALRVGHFFAPSGSVITVQVGQGGPRYSTNGVVRAWPDGGLSTNTTTANSCGGASSRIWFNGNLLEVTGGGGGGSSVGNGGIGGSSNNGGTGGGANAGTGGTLIEGGITGGAYLQGGDGPGCGGGGGYYGGGAGQASATAGGGGSSWRDVSLVTVLSIIPAVSGVGTGGTSDPDWASGIGSGGSGTSGGSGRIVLYVKPVEITP